MGNVYLKFYLSEKHRHNGKQLSEWILEKARQIGVPGGSVFRAVAGYGRHGRLHEETFIELGGELPVQVEFVLSAANADQLVAAISAEKLALPFVRYAVESGVTGN